MIPIIHRVNTLEKLDSLDSNVGIEIDIRSENGNLVLSHDPQKKSLSLKDFIENYDKKLIVANIKESGIEDSVIEYLTEKGINDFFLLDVEFPYILNNFEKSGKFLSLRFSKYESVESVVNFIDKVQWLWIDTYEDFFLDEQIAGILRRFKTVLVSPSRWKSEKNIQYYLSKLKEFDINLSGVMVESNEEII